MFSELQTSIQPLLNYFGENKYLQALIVVLLSFVTAWIFNRIIITTLKKLASKTHIDFDNRLVELLHSPVYYSLLLLGFSSATLLLSLSGHYSGFIFSLIKTFALIIWTLFLLRVSRLVLSQLAKNKKSLKFIHTQTLPLFLNLSNIAIIVLAIYFIFSSWHVDMTAWLASAGIAGIAIGFAAKDTLANLFSGVFIMADAPYKIGDFIVLDQGERGEVTHIGIRSTRILTRDDIEVTIPNSVIGNTKIINESGGPHEKYRCSVAVGVAYGSDIDKVREILMDVAEHEEHVCSLPEPRVRFRRFGPSSLDFELLFWIDKPVLRGSVLDLVHCKIYHKFIEFYIEIPYSKQDLYIKELPQSS